MGFDFLNPIDENVKSEIKNFSGQTLSGIVSFYNDIDEDEIEGFDIAIVCVAEARNSLYEQKSDFCFNDIRKALYKLFIGNWKTSILDLGDIQPGAETSDTEYALKSLVSELLKKNIVPIILGGSQDLTFAQYRAYDGIKYMVNLSTVDHKFDLGNSDMPMNGQSYVGKMIVDEPYNMFNYANLGYQTFLSPQEEIDLMDKLFFDALRLGVLKNDLKRAEPVLRDSDLLSIDVTSIKTSELGEASHFMPNGFSTFEFCALSRYAGMSEKLTSFGLYEIQSIMKSENFVNLIAQTLWYFFEGFNLRLTENISEANNNITKYSVPISDEILVFFKSEKSNRWWMEIPSAKDVDNNLNKASLLACDKKDYIDACNSVVPERWLNAKYKNLL
ncbi:formimidoylglutamase [Psychroflexus aestuariivivens]|uniref:formimidoylglutamase n=1 Tax=Psychroflexus aestuariivivens TaxID=1795040 RepID=UPI000FDC8CE7|nr:formimidoylglutamase [Psychroflexus aestuariivivens]